MQIQLSAARLRGSGMYVWCALSGRVVIAMVGVRVLSATSVVASPHVTWCCEPAYSL
jgi:hypothetical protein